MRPIQNSSAEGSDLPSAASRRARYRITIRGMPGAACSGWSDAAVENGDGTKTINAVVDQAALRGFLCQLWDLNATLIEVTLAPGKPEPEASVRDE